MQLTTINTVTGEISGGSAKVGDLNNSTDYVAAKLLGAFAGKYGEGRVIYQDADTNSSVPVSRILRIENRLSETIQRRKHV